MFEDEYKFFFFKQKTAYEMRISDWSSDVCSSDLRRATRWSGSARPVRTGKRPGDCDAVPGSVYSVRASARRRRIARPVPHARAMTTAAELYAQAVAALNRSDWARAHALAARVLAQATDSAGVQFVAGVAAMSLGPLPAAAAPPPRDTPLDRKSL